MTKLGSMAEDMRHIDMSPSNGLCIHYLSFAYALKKELVKRPTAFL